MASPLPIAEPQSASAVGYASRAYAQSLDEFGDLVELPASDGWLLARSIPDCLSRDLMGCYPLFSCRDWSRLNNELATLAEQFVSVSAVTDPFADATPAQLKAAFPDVCYEYKPHYVADLSRPLDQITPSHHRRNARKALAAVEVRAAADLQVDLPNWLTLYDALIERHAITGIARFSPRSFDRQWRVPGFAAFAAYDGDDVCGMTLWYVRDPVVSYHLAAYSQRGYELGASYALFWTSLTHFAKMGVRWAALGAGAGTTAAQSGLTRFKQGWSTETRPVYFGGRILQPETYRKLTRDVPPGLNYFPAYRSP